MAELGPTSPEYHREIGELVSDLGIDVVLAVGELARAYGGEWVADAAKAAERAPELVQPGDVVLVKGSRAVGLEVVGGSARRSPRLVERVLAAGIVAMAISILAGPEVHRLPAPERVRPAHPRGGPGRAPHEAGHADDGRRS